MKLLINYSDRHLGVLGTRGSAFGYCFVRRLSDTPKEQRTEEMVLWLLCESSFGQYGCISDGMIYVTETVFDDGDGNSVERDKEIYSLISSGMTAYTALDIVDKL